MDLYKSVCNQIKYEWTEENRKQDALRDWGSPEVFSEEKMCKIRPEVDIGITRMKSRMKSTAGRRSSMSR